MHTGVYTTLSFLSLVFGFYQGKTSNLPRIFCSDRTHEILGKYRQNIHLSKEFPCLKLTKEIHTTKERKDRGSCPRKCARRLSFFLCRTHQRVPTKTPRRVLTGKISVLTGNFPVLTKMYTKCARSIFTCPVFTCLFLGQHFLSFQN